MLGHQAWLSRLHLRLLPGFHMSNVLIVDDNPAVRSSLRLLIDATTDWEVCGEAENGARAVEKVRALAPDIVVLDLAMPVMNGLDAARQIAEIAPHCLMVMYTMHANEQLEKEARAAGIRSVVSKGGEGTDLVAVIRGLLRSRSVKRGAVKRRSNILPLV